MAASAAALAGSKLAIITGASQGYGRAIATALAKSNTSGNLVLLLAARSMEGLSETAAEVAKVRCEVTSSGVKLILLAPRLM